MLLKSSFLFFAASAMVAVSASPVPGTTKAPAKSPLFPDTTSPNAIKFQNELIQYLLDHSTTPGGGKAPVTGNPTTPSATKPATTKPTAPATKPATTKPTAPANPPPTKPTTPAKPPVTKTPTKPPTTKSPTTKPPKGKRNTDDIVSAIERYGEYANAAYYISSNAWNCPKCETSPHLAGTVVEKFFNEANGPSYGFIGRNQQSKQIIVAFRGTKVLQDAIADLKFLKTAWAGADNGAEVHSGFSKAYLSVAPVVLATIRDIEAAHGEHTIFFVGHSYGGAQASLAAADYVSKNPAHKSKVSLYTYGQPRTGNKIFADWMNKQNFAKYRVTYKGDIVSQVPGQFALYQHHGQEIHHSLGNQIKFCSITNGEDPTCQNSIPTRQLNVGDHSMYPGIKED